MTQAQRQQQNPRELFLSNQFSCSFLPSGHIITLSFPQDPTWFQLLATSLRSKLRGASQTNSCSNSFMASKATSDTRYSLISFPALRTHLPSHLKCKAKAQPIRDPTAFFLNTGGSVSCPSQASHWAFIFILSTHIPPVGSTRWFILQSCLQGTAGSCYGPDMEMLTNLLHFQVSSPAWRCIYRRLQILCPL